MKKIIISIFFQNLIILMKIEWFIYYIRSHESQIAHLFLFSGGGGTDALILITSLTCLSNQSSCPTLCVSCPHYSWGSLTEILNFGISIHLSSGSLLCLIPDTAPSTVINKIAFILIYYFYYYCAQIIIIFND